MEHPGSERGDRFVLPRLVGLILPGTARRGGSLRSAAARAAAPHHAWGYSIPGISSRAPSPCNDVCRQVLRHNQTHMPKDTLTPEIISAAIEGFDAQKRRIDEQIAALRAMLSGESEQVAAQPAPAKRKRRLSAAGRKRIGDAARKRWAAIREARAAEKPASASKRSGRKSSGKATAGRTITKRRRKPAAAQKTAAPAAGE